jgi:hypothetical protein
MNATTDFTTMSDQVFRKWVDKSLSADEYKNLYNENEAFRNRVNGNPWDSTPNVRDMRPKHFNPESELGRMIKADQEEADRPLKEAIKEFEEQAQALALEMRDKLKRRLDNSAGLTNDLINFFLNDAQYKNLPMMSMAGSPSFSKADKLEIKEAFDKFGKDVNREFTSDEQSALLRTLVDIGGIGKSLSPMDARCWKAAFVLAKTVGRITHEAKPTPEKPELLVNLQRAEPTKEEMQREYRTVIVVKWRGKMYTKADLERMLGDDYKAMLKETGYKDDGELLLNTDQLRPGRAR